MVLTVLGARGSVPVEGMQYEVFGGATSCMRLLIKDRSNHIEEIYLDAGSGIVSSKSMPESSISILISHMHLDHIQGLPFFNALTNKGRRIDIYAAPRNGLKVNDALDKVFSPPFWPLKITEYPADVHMHTVEKTFMIGDIRVDTLEVSHPGFSTTYKLSYDGKSLVYAVDYEHSEVMNEKLSDFVKGCDLLIYDGQFSVEEYPACRGYGHSIPEIGLEIARKNDVKNILFTHHSPTHDDNYMNEWEKRIQRTYPNSSFAKIGTEIIL